MRLNHADVVLGYDGEPIIQNIGDDETPVRVQATFRDLSLIALGHVDPTMPAEKKARIFSLALKFHRGKFISLTVDEAALLKDMGGVALSPLAFGRLSEWLEGKPQTVASDEDDVDIETP